MSNEKLILIGIVFLGVCMVGGSFGASYYSAHYNADADSDVLKQLDLYGGSIAMNDSPSSSNYVIQIPVDSHVTKCGEFIHIDKTGYSYYLASNSNV